MSPFAPSDPTIRSFWDWFQTIGSELAVSYASDQTLLDALTERVSLLGDITWEVGPGRDGNRALIISPDGAREWLPVTRYIVGLAPKIPGWEFHAARQPKEWNFRFSIRTGTENAIAYDASEWCYVLYEHRDGTFDIVIEQGNLQGVEDGDRYTAATIALDGILGEDTRLDLIVDIEAIRSLSSEQRQKATRLTELAKHIRSLHERKN